MTAQVSKRIFAERKRDGSHQPEPIASVLEEVCVAMGFGPHTYERCETAKFLTKLYSDGYFTVEGLRQAFVAYVEREISGRSSPGLRRVV